MTRCNITIDDTKWPKLRLVVSRETLNGGKTTSTTEAMYDVAYTVFENALHNNLRPMVEELNSRRLNNGRRNQ